MTSANMPGGPNVPGDQELPGGPSLPAGRSRESGLTVDASRLWPGGIATAIVAGLIALVGVLVCRWLFDIPLLAPRHDGAYGDVHTTGLVLAAAAAALIATALVHLLLISTPRALAFFGWIVGLATVLVVLFPFSTSAPLTSKIATALVDLVLGIAIGSLISSVAARSLRRTSPLRPQPPYDRRYDPDYDQARTTEY
jgi:hypothetical protein